MFLLNGKALPLDTPFSVGEGDEKIQYPAKWLRLASTKERAAIGITEAVEQPRPDERYNYVQDNGDGTYMAVPKDLGPLRDQVWELIKVERDLRKAGGVQVGSYWFHSDDTSRIQQIGLVMMGANIPAGLQWKTMSGEFVGMTQTLANQIFQAIAASDQDIFSIAEQHKAALMQSTTPLDYDYRTGWPQTYADTLIVVE